MTSIQLFSLIKAKNLKITIPQDKGQFITSWFIMTHYTTIKNQLCKSQRTISKTFNAGKTLKLQKLQIFPYVKVSGEKGKREKKWSPKCEMIIFLAVGYQI